MILELACFRKHARKIRKFRECGSLGRLSSVFLVLQLFNFSEPLLPGLELLSTMAEPVPFILILLFVSPETTHIDILIPNTRLF